MLGTTGNLCLDTGLLNLLAHFLHEALYIFITHILAQSDFLHQIIVSFRLKVFQRQILKFYLDLADTKTLRDRTINLLRLSCDTRLCLAGLVLERTHVV